MRTKHIETERLSFSHWEEIDLSLAEALCGDEMVTHFITKNGSFSTEQITQRLRFEIESQKECGLQYWPLFLKREEKFIGCCGLHAYDLENQIAEFGVHLLPFAWGNGFAEEGATGVIDYATARTDLSALFAGHHPDNHASEKLLRKIGFQFLSRNYYEPTGLEHPSYLLKLTANH